MMLPAEKMAYKFTLVCPRCEKVSELPNRPDRSNPRVNCGDCLLDAVEVVELKVVKVEETP